MKKIIIGFSLLGVIGFVYYLLRVGFHSDLNDYPHDATVWGTVSDWAMVLVTVVSAIYLIKTFRSQRTINRLSLLPEFKIIVEDGPDKTEPLLFYLFLQKNSAYRIATGQVHNYFTTNLKSPIDRSVSFRMIEGDKLKMHNLNLSADPNKAKFIFSFSDVVGNTYSQTVIFRGGVEYEFMEPILRHPYV